MSVGENKSVITSLTPLWKVDSGIGGTFGLIRFEEKSLYL